jgi:hypothetical protein
MKLETAKEVLALQRLEEADSAGVLISPEERLAATAVGGLVGVPGRAGDGQWTAVHDEALERRAHRLLRDERIKLRVREVMGEARSVRGRWVMGVVGVLALALGFVTNEVGGDKVINLLSIPMLGLLAWNFLVYIGVLVAKLRGEKPESEGHGPHRWLNRWLLKGAGVKIEAAKAEDKPPEGDVAALVWQARAKFWHRWVRVLRTEAFYWTEIILHMGAAALATGLIGGMYVRGLAFEYNAAWESTFLRAPAVSRVLQVSLGPAAVLLRKQIPDPAEMQRLNIHDQEVLDPHKRESAAKWIHLYATTALLFIGLPRLGLAAVAGLTVRRLHDVAPVEKDLRHYFDALVRQASGREIVATVIPFSHDLDGRRRDDMRALLHRLWPTLGHVEFWPSIAYGDEEQRIALINKEEAAAKKEVTTTGTSGRIKPVAGNGPAVGQAGPAKSPAASAQSAQKSLPGRLAVLMSFSATPEEEVHGFVVRELSRRVPVTADEAGFAVVLDSAPFRRQFAALPEFERRLRERRAAWDRLLDGLMTAALSEDADFFVWRRIGQRKQMI